MDHTNKRAALYLGGTSFGTPSEVRRSAASRNMYRKEVGTEPNWEVSGPSTQLQERAGKVEGAPDVTGAQTVTRGRRLTGFLGLSLNDRTILFPGILLDKTVSVG